MSFTIKGIALGQESTVTWAGGEVRGDKFMALWIRARAENLEGAPVGPPEGPYTTTNHLASPLSAFFLIEQLFEQVTVVEGEVPVVPPPPWSPGREV